MLDVQEVEQVGGDGRYRAVREVEDARGLVRQHQADAGQSEDGSGGDPDDDVRKPIVHRGSLPLVLAVIAGLTMVSRAYGDVGQIGPVPFGVESLPPLSCARKKQFGELTGWPLVNVLPGLTPLSVSFLGKA